jgi:lactoylglutathione lyase
MQAPGYVFVELYVEDMPYYLLLVRDVLGFEVVRTEEGWAELRSSHGTIILNRHDDPEPGHPFEHFAGVQRRGFGVEIGIVCDSRADLSAKWARARRVEGCVVTDIVDQDWGMTDFRILTPQGYYLRVTTPRAG